ncbi:hypothetical protein ABEV55_18395 [Aneurinibacillus thermoaerophilus]|uniref:hypothetical protein n=1 Tax=Aneurinibacillus thermoaerophilus TaxID=143495 RepID=UPI002E20D73B|nr:hypothetical protein [Aneurinibacillus thermoaerophilus]
MSVSLLVTNDQLLDYQRQMDNLLIAKIVYDAGTPLSEQKRIIHDGYTYFYEAVSCLFQSPVCYENDKEEYEEDGKVFSIRVVQVEEWKILKQMFANNPTFDEDNSRLLGMIDEVYDEFENFVMYVQMTSFGLRVTIQGDSILFHKLLEILVNFKEELDKKLSIWKKKGEFAYVSNTDHHRNGKLEICERRAVS